MSNLFSLTEAIFQQRTPFEKAMVYITKNNQAHANMNCSLLSELEEPTPVLWAPTQYAASLNVCSKCFALDDAWSSVVNIIKEDRVTQVLKEFTLKSALVDAATVFARQNPVPWSNVKLLSKALSQADMQEITAVAEVSWSTAHSMPISEQDVPNLLNQLQTSYTNLFLNSLDANGVSDAANLAMEIRLHSERIVSYLDGWLNTLSSKNTNCTALVSIEKKSFPSRATNFSKVMSPAVDPLETYVYTLNLWKVQETASRALLKVPANVLSFLSTLSSSVDFMQYEVLPNSKETTKQLDAAIGLWDPNIPELASPKLVLKAAAELAALDDLLK